MKITKILSAVAAASIATTALAATASAFDMQSTTSNTPYVSATGGMIGGFVFGNGESDVPEGNLMGEIGFEPSDIGGCTFTFTIPEMSSFGTDDNRTFWDGNCGGDFIFSFRTVEDKRTYNWPVVATWWGVTDEALEINTTDPEAEPISAVKVDDYTYQVTAMFNFDEQIAATPGDLQDCRIFGRAWGDSLAEWQALDIALLDDDGDVIVKLNAEGDIVEQMGGADAGDATDDAGSTDNAGDTNASTDDNKASADTGVEGVAAVAGVAVLAAGAAILSKKRK